MLEQAHLHMITVLFGQGVCIVMLNFSIGFLQAYRRPSILGTYRWCYLPSQALGIFFMVLDIYVMHADHVVLYLGVLFPTFVAMLFYVINTEETYRRVEKMK